MAARGLAFRGGGRRGEQRASKKEDAKTNFTIRGAALSITSDDILRATWGALPTPIDGRNKYFLKIQGRRFPIKQVIRLVTGLPSIGFAAQDSPQILT